MLKIHAKPDAASFFTPVPILSNSKQGSFCTVRVHVTSPRGKPGLWRNVERTPQPSRNHTCRISRSGGTNFRDRLEPTPVSGSKPHLSLRPRGHPLCTQESQAQKVCSKHREETDVNKRRCKGARPSASLPRRTRRTARPRTGARSAPPPRPRVWCASPAGTSRCEGPSCAAPRGS